MTVIVGVRDIEQAKKAVAEVIDSGKQKNVVYERLDVGSLTSVRSFAQRVQERFDIVHILVNNGMFFLNFSYEILDGVYFFQLES